MRMPCVVHLDLHDVGLEGGEARHRAGIRRRLGDHDVAGIEERAAHEVDHLLAAGGDHDVVGLDRRCPRRPSPARCSGLTSSRPSVGPYWSAAALESTATRDISHAKSSAGNVVVSGRPVASEITSGRAVTAIMSRIAEEVMPRVRLGEQAAVALDLVRAGGGHGLRGCLVYRHAPRQNASATMDYLLDLLQGLGIAAAIGIRPFLPTLLAGALAAADLGLDFESTDFSFLE